MGLPLQGIQQIKRKEKEKYTRKGITCVCVCVFFSFLFVIYCFELLYYTEVGQKIWSEKKEAE